MEIEDWRRKIDEIDLLLVELLNKRSQCAIEIGKIKERLNIRIYDPKREEQVAQNVQAATPGPLSRDAIRRLFERIIDESRRAEREARQAREIKREERNREAAEGERHPSKQNQKEITIKKE